MKVDSGWQLGPKYDSASALSSRNLVSLLVCDPFEAYANPKDLFGSSRIMVTDAS